MSGGEELGRVMKKAANGKEVYRASERPTIRLKTNSAGGMCDDTMSAPKHTVV